MQDTFQWTDELVLQFVNKCFQFTSLSVTEQSVQQFKSSKSPKKEWEIVAFLEESSATLWKLREDGLYRCDRFLDQPGYPLQSFLDDRDPIHSVRRLSDGEVFTKNEVVETPKDGQHHIGGFEIVGNDIVANFSTGKLLLKHLQKLPQPILVTHDGKEIFPGDNYYFIAQWDIWYTGDNHNWVGSKEGLRAFSTREAAEEYILNNRPVLSLNDVKEACEGLYTNSLEIVLKKATEIVKQKPNQ